MSYFGIALTAGFGDIAAREVARNRGAAASIASDVTAVKLLTALAGIAAAAALALVLEVSPLQRTVLILSSIGLVSLALDTTWAYRGLARNRTGGAALLLSQLAYLAGVLMLVRVPGDVVRVPLIQFAGDLAAAAILLALMFSDGFKAPSLARGFGLLRKSGSATVSRLLRALIVTFGVVLLGMIGSARDVGLYSAAYRVCMFVTMIAVATHVAFLPGLARASLEGPERVSVVLTRSILLTSAAILPLVAGGLVLAEPLLSLVFGNEYAAAAPAFRLLLLSIGVLALHGTAHNVFVGLHRTGTEAVMFGAAAALNIALNLALIPAYGLVGAASATLAAEAVILAGSLLILSRMQMAPRASPILVPFLAAAVMGTVLHALSRSIPVLLLLPVGAGIYGAVLWSTGGLRRVMNDAAASDVSSP